MQILGVIPARYASQRFPGKPLALIDGKPMIECVYEAAVQCRALTDVVVATDDLRIAEAVEKFGGKVCMTRSDHTTGTDRVAEVAEQFPAADVVVNIQGDQPFVTAEMLDSLVSPYVNGDRPPMATLACAFTHEEQYHDPNAVKVLCDQQMRALYFSRAAVPFYRERHEAPVFHHLGLYAFTRDFLKAYASLAPTPFEQCEQLEQLRVLEHGYEIRLSLTDYAVPEVNTPADLAYANNWARQRRFAA